MPRGELLFESEATRVYGNLIQGSRDGVVIENSSDAVAEMNVAYRNATDGLRVEAESVGTILGRNFTNRNGDDGIDVEVPRCLSIACK